MGLDFPLELRENFMARILQISPEIGNRVMYLRALAGDALIIMDKVWEEARSKEEDRLACIKNDISDMSMARGPEGH
jgi:hypothetical protein